MFIEDYAKIASRVGRFNRAVLKFGQLLLKSDQKKFGFWCLRLVGLQSSKKKYAVEHYEGE